MKLMILEEKHGNRYILGHDPELMASSVIRDRINDDYWYDEDELASAEVAISSGSAWQWLSRRRSNYEYESVELVTPDVVT